MQHPDNRVNQALAQLNDALCSWERSTGRQSVLILREEGGYVHRSASGKPTVPDDVPDSLLLQMVESPLAQHYGTDLTAPMSAEGE